MEAPTDRARRLQAEYDVMRKEYDMRYGRNEDHDLSCNEAKRTAEFDQPDPEPRKTLTINLKLEIDPEGIKAQHELVSLLSAQQYDLGIDSKGDLLANVAALLHTIKAVCGGKPKVASATNQAFLLEYSKLVLDDINDQQTGWYYQFQSAIQAMERETNEG